MKTLFFRLISALLLLCVLAGTAACSTPSDTDAQTTEPSADTTNTDTTAPSADVDENGYLNDQLPNDLDYGDQGVTMLTWEDVEHEEFFVEEMTGDVVGDAIYKRTLTVEERLGVKLEEITCKANASNINTWVNFISNDNLSGSHAFDIMAGYSQSMASAASQSLCYDLLDADCEYLNFDNPWWSELLIEQATINGKLYFCSGDISINALYMMYVCYVSDEMVENYALAHPRDLVLDGKWTYDKFFELCNGLYSDLDGDGVKSLTDQYGYMTYSYHTDPWFYGSGAVMVDKDADGSLKVSDSFGGEKVISTIERLNSLLWDSNDGIHWTEVKHQSSFGEGRLLFMMDRARASFKTLSAYDIDYTIIPCPKYDEAQERYYTVLGVPFTLYALPIDCEDPTMCSAILECLASESYRMTTPAAFEITLKTKYALNETTSQMYDIIRENLTYDIGRLFASALMGVDTFRKVIRTNQTNYASSVASMEKIFAKKLLALEEAFE